MAKTTNRSSLLLIAALGLAGAVAGCGKGLPSTPSYATDVLPIFRARCLRCHGDAILPDGSISDPAMSLQPAGSVDPRTALTVYKAYIGQYDSVGCDTDAGSGCQLGAKYFATTPPPGATTGNILSDVIYGGALTNLPMPPPPARALSDWEATVVDSWTQTTQP
jgi:hypothetical protein